MKNELDPDHEDFNLELWAEAQWDNWPDIETDLQFGLNFKTLQFDYCAAYFSYWKWKIDFTLDILPTFGDYKLYRPQCMIDIGQLGGLEQ